MKKLSKIVYANFVYMGQGELGWIEFRRSPNIKHPDTLDGGYCSHKDFKAIEAAEGKKREELILEYVNRSYPDKFKASEVVITDEIYSRK